MNAAFRIEPDHPVSTSAAALCTWLKGVITDLVTPFRHGEIDHRGLRALVDRQIDQGVGGLSVCGITGEGSSLTPEERAQVIRICVDTSRGRVPVLAATGTNSTETTVSLTRNAKALGADAAIVVVPYYSKPTQAGIVHHVETVARSVDLPLLVFNAADHTGIQLHPLSALRLASLPSVAGIIEAGREAAGLSGPRCGGPAILSAHDRTMMPFHFLGGVASLSAIANVFPARVVALCRACHECNLQEALALEDGLSPMLEACAAQGEPATIKWALHLISGIDPHVRLPLVPADAPTKKAVHAALHPFDDETDTGMASGGFL